MYDLLLAEFNDTEIDTEQSVQGMDGVDIWTLVIDGETYEARLDWREELEMIFEEGSDAAAEWFFGVILDIMNI